MLLQLCLCFFSSKTRQWRNRTLRCCCFPSTSHGQSYYQKGMQVHSSMWWWPTEKDSIDFAQALCIYHLGFTLSWYVQILNIGPLSGWRFKIFTSPLCDWLTFIPKAHFLTVPESLPPSPLAAWAALLFLLSLGWLVSWGKQAPASPLAVAWPRAALCIRKLRSA